MRAVFIRTPGGPEVLEIRDVPDPEPPFGHVRVRVHAAGVNRADLLQRAGAYPAPPGAPPDIPGLEYVGVVESVGAGVRRFSGGERVYGLVGGGAYAEKVIAHEGEVARVPENLSDEEAGAVPEAFLTALDALLVRGRLVAGERVLIHAVGSGVGTAGVQIARALGCTVIGTSRTADKLERCKELGMDAGVVAEKGTFADKVKEVAGGGIDVVLDLVGAAYLKDNLAVAAPRARIVCVGLTGGTQGEIDLGVLLRKRIEIVGTVIRARELAEKIALAQLLDKTIGPWLARGMVKPVVDKVFPLGEAKEAHAYVASNASFGKVLLDARDARG
ncbi:NAD(P)H-quinone oxidoreductase [Chondromyces apiculatus]|uniref:Quinone oxidoreductase n=1 Tax=Chondromyces apiculatus DSM 436 TaxID=1192034 RepID=A0A017T619_9BACT|nr:NAD(P)H-quinone oxidoreductase [Chondromyces apiculatus]EYF04467.1 Quinone oxidoreductase [Chondromyces apiculatus DSM 436]